MKYLAQRFHSEFPQPFALPTSLAHSTHAGKENFLELDREIALVMEGMDSIADLVLGVVCVYVCVCVCVCT